MTENKIIKALECCSKDRALTTKDCMHECPYFNVLNCQRHCMRDALNLINRLKAENERLKEDIKAQDSSISSLMNIVNSNYQLGRIEGYKEFAERLKETFDTGHLYGKDAIVRRIDNL